MSQEKYLIDYNKFLSEILILYPTISYISELQNETDDVKLSRGTKLAESLNTTTNYNCFFKSKIKVFSHKEKDTAVISESLFGKNLTLKKIFNNQSEDVKTMLWSLLHKIVGYMKSEMPTPNINDVISNTKDYINKILSTTDLDDNINEMINDIIKEFEGIFTDGGNPMENFVKINDLITTKYKDKIESGEIDLQKIMNALQKSIPGLGEMEGLGDILKNFTSGTTEPKEKVIIDENFSTSNIDVGQVKEDNNFNLGPMLKTMDKFSGLLSNGSGDGENNGMDKLLGIFNKLNSNTNPMDLQNLIQDELGINMNQLTEQMSSILKKND